ncbi:hypothetical protein BGZ63DRAFT_271050 [Mariannaea sp. PMI_226]|nr:hypothetical protein BGZ63DRAFT_271050 [Mariannaea sp. PMI_226]
MAEIDDSQISVRFKHGIHTIYLFIDALAPFSEVSTELVQILKERYPQGLTTAIAPPVTTPVPDESDARLTYGVLKVPNDPSRGWKKLKVQDGDTPTKLGIKNNSLIAFMFLEDDEEVEFAVDWPRDDEEMYDAQ